MHYAIALQETRTPMAHEGNPSVDPTVRHIENEQPKDTQVFAPAPTPPRLLVDSHMHIMSAGTLTLPSLHGQVPVLGTKLRMDRSKIQWLGENVEKILLVGTFFLFKPLFLFLAGRKVLKSGNDVDGDILYETRLVKGTKIGGERTSKVGAFFLKRIEAVKAQFRGMKPYKDAKDLEVCTVTMTMDMEYAHLFGYFGIPIYHPIYKSETDLAGKTKEVLDGYWYPVHADWKKEGEKWTPITPGSTAPEVDTGGGVSPGEYEKLKTDSGEQGIPGAIYSLTGAIEGVKSIQCVACLAPPEETKLYETWKEQLAFTEETMCEGQLRILPMFHYDPRRWQNLDDSEAFAKVSKDGLYLGFKLYTAQGYQPWDIKRLPKLRSFYEACEERGIPIMNHGTPTGANTFDMESYLYFKHPKDGPEEEEEKKRFLKKGVRTIEWGDGRTTTREYDASEPINYFQENFVSPEAWEKVLKEFPKLRLCIAHYCGASDMGQKWHGTIVPMLKNYEHLYVDLSSSLTYRKFRKIFKNKLLTEDTQHKILFGSDWYMCMLRASGMDLTEYCKEGKEFIEDIDPKYWELFTEINPCRFYRFEDRIKKMGEALKKERKAPEIKQGQYKKPESSSTSPQSATPPQTASPISTEPVVQKEWKDGEMEAIDLRAQRIEVAALEARKRDPFILKPGGNP